MHAASESPTCVIQPLGASDSHAFCLRRTARRPRSRPCDSSRDTSPGRGAWPPSPPGPRTHTRRCLGFQVRQVPPAGVVRCPLLRLQPRLRRPDRRQTVFPAAQLRRQLVAPHVRPHPRVLGRARRRQPRRNLPPRPNAPSSSSFRAIPARYENTPVAYVTSNPHRPPGRLVRALRQPRPQVAPEVTSRRPRVTLHRLTGLCLQSHVA